LVSSESKAFACWGWQIDILRAAFMGCLHEHVWSRIFQRMTATYCTMLDLLGFHRISEHLYVYRHLQRRAPMLTQGRTWVACVVRRQEQSIIPAVKFQIPVCRACPSHDLSMNQVHVHQRQANANDSPVSRVPTRISQRVYNLCTQLRQPKPRPSGLALALGVEDEGNNEPVSCQQLVHLALGSDLDLPVKPQHFAENENQHHADKHPGLQHV
jgi:hypothetical protein